MPGMAVDYERSGLMTRPTAPHGKFLLRIQLEVTDLSRRIVVVMIAITDCVSSCMEILVISALVVQATAMNSGHTIPRTPRRG